MIVSALDIAVPLPWSLTSSSIFNISELIALHAVIRLPSKRTEDRIGHIIDGAIAFFLKWSSYKFQCGGGFMSACTTECVTKISNCFLKIVGYSLWRHGMQVDAPWPISESTGPSGQLDSTLWLVFSIVRISRINMMKERTRFKFCYTIYWSSLVSFSASSSRNV